MHFRDIKMNGIINKFLSVDDKSCLQCIKENLDLRVGLVEHLLKTEKEYKNFKKPKVQDIFIKLYLSN